jgi:hypothetical protein
MLSGSKFWLSLCSDRLARSRARRVRRTRPKNGKRHRGSSSAFQAIEHLEQRILLTSTATIAGTVYVDIHHTGNLDSNPGLAGVTVTLTGVDSHGNALTPETTVTNASGAYSFPITGDVINAGTYTVTETHPTGYVDETPTPGTPFGGTVGVSGGNELISKIVIPLAGLNGTNYNFGELLPTPSISTTPSTTSSGVVGSAILNDTAQLSGGNNPTGSIVFTLYAPNGSVAYTVTDTVSGDGNYSTSNTAVATQVGTYQWVASYGGNTLNNPVTSNSGSEPVTTTPASPGDQHVSVPHQWRGGQRDPQRHGRPHGRLQPNRIDHLHVIRARQLGGLHGHRRSERGRRLQHG